MKITSAFAFMVLLPATAALAVPVPAGPSFQVNQVTQNYQYQPDVASDAAGDFVIVWTDLSADPARIKIRLFDALGAPASDEIVVAGAPQSISLPRVAMTAVGEIAVAWENNRNIYLRRFDRHGQATEFPVAVSGLPGAASPDLVLDAAGHAVVVWTAQRADGDLVLLQRLGADDKPAGAVELVNQPAPFSRDNPKLAVDASGDLLVSWNDHRLGADNVDIWARRYDGTSRTWNAEVRINPSTSGVQQGSVPVIDSEGNGAVVYADLAAQRLLVRRLDAAGAPAGDPLPITTIDALTPFRPDAAAGPDGTVLVTWPQPTDSSDSRIKAAFFDRSWSPAGAELLVSSPQSGFEGLPAVSAGPAGDFVLVWNDAGSLINSPIPELPPGARDGRDGSYFGVFARRFEAPPAPPPVCMPASDTLCLGGNRFQVRVSWKDGAGNSFAAHTHPLDGDIGAFWFSAPSNLELMVRVLDARLVNGHFEVAYGSLSNVEFTVQVTDVATGTARTYHNAPGVYASISDEHAFPTEAAAVAPPAAAAVAPTAGTSPTAAAIARCSPTPTAFCSLDRFLVKLDFVDPLTGATLPAHAVPVTANAGAFWFFDPGDLKVMVKVLDARAFNHYFWVFYGALTDLEYTVTVTDTVNRTTRIYHNPRHHLASSADTRAFRARTPPR